MLFSDIRLVDHSFRDEEYFHGSKLFHEGTKLKQDFKIEGLECIILNIPDIEESASELLKRVEASKKGDDQFENYDNLVYFIGRRNNQNELIGKAQAG